MKKTQKKASRKNVTKNWFSNWSNEYDNTLGKIGFHTDLLSIMSKNSTIRNGDKVLDIGKIELARPGSLSKGRPKTNRIIDKRTKLTGAKAVSAVNGA